MRGRVQGLDVAFFNAELRWRFVHFTAARQNIYLALNGFVDGGMVTRNYNNLFRGDVSFENLAMYRKYVNPNRQNALHTAAGGGFRIAINQNFIIAVDYARPFKKQDGTGGLYVNTGYLF
jgi:hemolysin activation/secretion protein